MPTLFYWPLTLAMTAPAAPRMSTELRVWCLLMTALSTQSKSVRRSCTSGWRFSRLSAKEEDAKSKCQCASVKFRNNASRSDLQNGKFISGIPFAFSHGVWHRWFSVLSTCTVGPSGDRRSQLWGSESDGVGRLSGNLHCLPLSLGDRAHRKKSANISARPRQVPMMNARIPMGFCFCVRARGTPGLLEYCYYSHKGQMHMK